MELDSFIFFHDYLEIEWFPLLDKTSIFIAGKNSYVINYFSIYGETTHKTSSMISRMLMNLDEEVRNLTQARGEHCSRLTNIDNLAVKQTETAAKWKKYIL